MNSKPTIETVVYALAIILSVIAMLLVAATPSYLLDVRGVYQAF